MKKVRYRKLFYLLAIAVICIIGLIYSDARLKMLSAIDMANKKFLSSDLKQDTEEAQKFFYARYRPDTDYIERTNSVGMKDYFFNVCQASCALFKGSDAEQLCADLYSNDKFDKYRVYYCSVEVTLENDQPLMCEAISWRTFKTSCDLQVAKT